MSELTYEQGYLQGRLDELEGTVFELDKLLQQDNVKLLTGQMALSVFRASLAQEWEELIAKDNEEG